MMPKNDLHVPIYIFKYKNHFHKQEGGKDYVTKGIYFTVNSFPLFCSKLVKLLTKGNNRFI